MALRVTLFRARDDRCACPCPVSLVLVVLAVVLLGSAGSAVALGGEEQQPPAAAVSADIPHISPAHSQGVRDATTLVPTIEIHQVGGAVKAYRLVISDEGGRPVRTMEGDDGEPIPGFIARIFMDLGLQERTSVEVPESFIWDGRDDAGERVPEGIYSFVLEITDDYGKRGTSEPRQLMVDNTPPEIVATVEYDIFSPDGDGSRDTLPVLQSGSSEVRWVGQFLDASGEVVRTLRWTDGRPTDFLWDGRNDVGELLPDGTYRYRVSARDLAGNDTTVILEGLLIDTAARHLGIDLETPAFSPNGDGMQDELLFLVTIDQQDRVSNWLAEVRNLEGRVMRTIAARGPVSQPFRFDGRDDEGTVIPEGTYSLMLSTTYENGSTRVVSSPPFRLDITPPDAFVQLHYDRISPNGDGVRDFLLVTQEVSGDGAWLVTVTSAAGDRVWSEHLENANVTFRWDGRDELGAPVSDGYFTYVLSALDGAGNEYFSGPLGFMIDTRDTSVSLHAGGTHFSPNDDGVKDIMEITPVLAVTDSIDWIQLDIVDAAGTVWHRDATESATETFAWTGLANDGKPFPDGEYSVRLAVRYANGNSGSAEVGPITLDTMFPTIEASTDELVFSPDGDGVKDDLLIRQISSAEDLWEARFLDSSGQAVVTVSWQGQVTDYRWDGIGEQGSLVPDGKYGYEVKATDTAGNSVTARLPGIQLDTRPVEARVDITEVNRVGEVSSFSPNADGEQDVMLFTLFMTVDVPVETWTLAILDPEEVPLRIFSGVRYLPQHVQSWDGLTDSGEMAPDGEYGAVFTVVYRKGDVVKDRLDVPIVLDTVYPEFEVEADYLLFSPDGDGGRDVLEIAHVTDVEHEWHTELTAADGTVVREYTVNEGVLDDLIWDGTDKQGTVVPDGEYRYRVRGTDIAGNVTTGELSPIIVDTRTGGAWMEVSTTGFSPNGDGVDDELLFELRVTQDLDLQSWELTIAGADGGSVRTYSGVSGTDFPMRLAWDGSDYSGARSQDGEYEATFKVEYTKGDVTEVAGNTVVVDTMPPAVRVGAGYLLFSPDGDGNRDLITLTHEATPGDRWEATITDDRDGSVVLRRLWGADDHLPDLVWDGRTDAGVAVPDGTFTYRIASTDAGGNRVSADLDGIQVDTVTTVAAVVADGDAFSPNGDDDRDTIGILITATASTEIDRWRLTIFDGIGSPVRTFRGGRGAVSLPEVVVWDGRNDIGSRVEDGFYRASLSINYVKGNINEDTTDPFLMDAAPPDAAIGTELDTPSLPFSPDDDGVNDELKIMLEAYDEGGIAAWTLKILDPYGETFASSSGSGPPPAFSWDGFSAETGELVEAAVDYTLLLEVVDHVGNRAQASEVVPIDLLVLREGDRLRIRISSINFASNTADYQRLGDPEKTRRNLQTLDRLAEILQRYETYNVLLDGHAVSVYWADTTRARREHEEVLLPLSAERARAVRDALIERGILAGRMTTTGLGGAEPIVPHGDLRNRWKNRRVEFWLIRQ